MESEPETEIWEEEENIIDDIEPPDSADHVLIETSSSKLDLYANVDYQFYDGYASNFQIT